MSRRAFDTVTAGDQLPPVTEEFERYDLIRYAGVSGDLNPIHWDDEVARRIGLDGSVAHGMLTMGAAGGYVTDWVGDPGAVLELNVRFTSPLYVPTQLEGPVEVIYAGKVKSVDPQTRTAVLALTATVDGRKLFGRATATVALA